MVEGKPLPTIWDVPDDLWERIEPVMLELDPPKSKGRNRVDQRKMLEGIIFRLRSGCQWNHLPKELGDDSTIHRTFQRWVGCGALEGIWAVLIEECQELGGVNWEWQSADCSMGKGAFWGGAIGRNPTDRGKAGSKKSILVDGRRTLERCGGWSQRKNVETDLGEQVVGRPQVAHCPDKGYDNPTGHGTVAAYQYCPHIRRIGAGPMGRKNLLGGRGLAVQGRAILVRYGRPITWACFN